MVFPVDVNGCENWTWTEHQRTGAFELWCWRRLLRVPWTARRSNQSILKETVHINCEGETRSVMSDSFWLHEWHSPWNSPGQNTGVGSLSLLQGIFLTQGLNPGIPPCRRILYQLSHKRSPRILESVAYSFCSGSSRPRNQTRVSCIADGFFTNWAMREAHINFKINNSAKSWQSFD